MVAESSAPPTALVGRIRNLGRIKPLALDQPPTRVANATPPCRTLIGDHAPAEVDRFVLRHCDKVVIVNKTVDDPKHLFAAALRTAPGPLILHV